MQVVGIEAERFLSVGAHVRLDLGPGGPTVLTGPNGAGKTNLGACLDLARAVTGRAAGDPAAERLSLYESAGHDGAESFWVALDLSLDQPQERRRVWAFVCAAYACSPRSGHDAPSPDEDDAQVREWLAEESLASLWSGRLLIRYDTAVVRPWFAAWEFRHGDGTWHVVLEGDASGQLRRGPADSRAPVDGAGNVKDWLLASKPQAETRLDFGVALERMSQPAAFSVQSLSSGPGRVPGSLRDLAPGLAATDYTNRGFTFEYVLSSLLQRALVLTDNRRLPLRRRFSWDEIWEPAELRDGAAVAAELYRLKSRGARERELFREVQETFESLTGRVLDVRASPADNDQGPGIIIEPVVLHGRKERPVAFEGAGVQEALLLSVLLADSAGKMLVLDEPAVNLEPTVQRRLLRGLRGPGQCLVITHHADLVPVEELADLRRIVRIAPGPAGARVLRPGFGDLDARDTQQMLRLLTPSHVRALLLARAVIFCEGLTEVKALVPWWRDTSKLGLSDPETANIPVISVDGHSSFGAYARYLEAFSVPWAIVVDGPAMCNDSKMARQLAKLGRAPADPPADSDDFASWREAWETAGVFTVAGEFGTDGSKGGEFEAFLRKVDADLLALVQNEVGIERKPAAAALFAAEHPEPPPEILDLYRKIAGWFGPGIVPADESNAAQ